MSPPAEVEVPGGGRVPMDDYTPHGYLDLPGHTRRLTPKGVLRSHDVGFRWHFPALATSYGGRRETYRAGVRVGLDGAIALADFDTVSAPRHTKNVVRFVARRGRRELDAEFFTVDDDVLCARIRATPERHLTLWVGYTRLVAADHGWGESGLVGRRTANGLVLQGFEDGEAFVLEVLGPTVTSRQAVTSSLEIAGSWARDGVEPSGDPVATLGASGEQVSLSGVVTVPSDAPGRDVECVVLLARGRTVDEAQARLAHARQVYDDVRAERIADDERFWSRAPRLDGDWPDHWRRGLGYDLETLRMMVKQPVGIYQHSWDAMQIQAPRVVLGEAAIDALLLAYADVEAGQSLLYGTFADAPLANVPCSREDGSYNMVSADGTVCGTGPQWGYPWLVLRHLFALRPDCAWLRRIYPYLAAYLEWWLAHRRDADGWLVHACSWESGQDLSPRFGEQPLGGGHPTWTTRPVDLQASFAHAAATMAEFAAELGREGAGPQSDPSTRAGTPDWTREVARWQELAEDCRGRTEKLWAGDRYADVDGLTGAPTGVDDVMLLAPVALGLASGGHIETLRASIGATDADTVVWPMFAWTAVDAALAVGDDTTATRIASAVVDRAYRCWDSRDHVEGRTLPGIACEYWPLSGRCGGEGYGWGAFTTHLLLGVLVGLRPSVDGITVRPNLPTELRTPGRRYAVQTTLRGTSLEVSLRPTPAGVEVDLAGRSVTLGWGEEAHWSWEEVSCATLG